MENPFELILERLERIEKAIEELKNEKSSDLMNVEEVAEYLSLAKTTIYGLSHKKEIPMIKKGKKLYFLRSEIDKWMFMEKRMTTSDIEQAANEYLLKNRLL